MSESGGRDPIIIPIGFVIDETSLNAAIREAKRRFAEALSVPDGDLPSYGGWTPRAGQPGPDAQTEAERRMEDEAVGIFEREYRGINERLERSVADMEQKTVDIEAYWGSISGLIEQATVAITTTTAVEPVQERDKVEPSEFVSAILRRADVAGESDILIPDKPIEKDTTDEILEVADKSMFDDAQRTAFMEEVWKYLKNWITNMPGPGAGFGVTQPPPFERITTEGTEKEMFEGVALIAGREEAREFFDSITDRLKDDELRWAIYDDLMKNLVMVTGGITEAGGIGLQVMLNADEMEEGSVEAANRTALMLQERLTKGLLSSPELFTELATILQDKVVDAFTQRGERVDAMTTAIVEVTPTFMAREAPEEGIPNIPNLLTVTKDVLTKLESRLEGWKPEEAIPEPIPEEFATLADIKKWILEWKPFQERVTKELEWVEKAGSRTMIMEGAMQKATSLVAKPGEKRFRREAPEDFVSSELYPMSIVEEMVKTVEGLEEVKAMFGVPFATDLLQATHRYEIDATRLHGQIRRRHYTPVAEIDEPFAILRQDEEIRSPEEEGVRFRELAITEMSKLYPRGDAAIGIGDLFNPPEKGPPRGPSSGEWLMDEILKGEQRREFIQELMKTGVIPGLTEETSDYEEPEDWKRIMGDEGEGVRLPIRFVDEQIQREKEAKLQKEEEIFQYNIERKFMGMVNKLEALLGISTLEEDPAEFQAYSRRHKLEPGLKFSDEQAEDIAESVASKVTAQMNIYGHEVPRIAPVKKKKLSKAEETDMQRLLEEWFPPEE